MSISKDSSPFDLSCSESYNTDSEKDIVKSVDDICDEYYGAQDIYTDHLIDIVPQDSNSSSDNVEILKTSSRSKMAEMLAPKSAGLRLAKIKDLQETIGKVEVNGSDIDNQESVSEKKSSKEQAVACKTGQNQPNLPKVTKNGSSNTTTSVLSSVIIESIQKPIPISGLSDVIASHTFVSSGNNQTEVSSVASNAQVSNHKKTINIIKPTLPVVSLAGHPFLPQQLKQPYLLSAQNISKPISFQPNSSQSSLIHVKNLNRTNSIQQSVASQNVPRPSLVFQNQTSRPALVGAQNQITIRNSNGLVTSQFSRPSLPLYINSTLLQNKLSRPPLMVPLISTRTNSGIQNQLLRPSLSVAQKMPRFNIRPPRMLASKPVIQFNNALGQTPGVSLNQAVRIRAPQIITSTPQSVQGKQQPSFIPNQTFQLANQNQQTMTYVPTNVPGVYKQAFPIPTPQVKNIVQQISSNPIVPLQGIGYQVSSMSNIPVQSVTQTFSSSNTLRFQNVLTQASSISTIPAQKAAQLSSSNSSVPFKGIFQQATSMSNVPVQSVAQPYCSNNTQQFRNFFDGPVFYPSFKQAANSNLIHRSVSNKVVNVQPLQVSSSINLSSSQRFAPSNSPGDLLLSDLSPSQPLGSNISEPQIQMPVIGEVSSLAMHSLFDNVDFQSASPIPSDMSLASKIQEKTKDILRGNTSKSANKSSSSYDNPHIALIRENIKLLEKTDNQNLKTTMLDIETDSIIHNILSSNNSLADTEVENQQTTSDVVIIGENRLNSQDLFDTCNKEENLTLKILEKDMNKLEAFANYCSVQHWMDNSVDISREIVELLADEVVNRVEETKKANKKELEQFINAQEKILSPNVLATNNSHLKNGSRLRSMLQNSASYNDRQASTENKLNSPIISEEHSYSTKNADEDTDSCDEINDVIDIQEHNIKVEPQQPGFDSSTTFSQHTSEKILTSSSNWKNKSKRKQRFEDFLDVDQQTFEDEYLPPKKKKRKKEMKLMSLTDITSKLKQNKLSNKEGFFKPKKSCDRVSANADQMCNNSVIKSSTKKRITQKRLTDDPVSTKPVIDSGKGKIKYPTKTFNIEDSDIDPKFEKFVCIYCHQLPPKPNRSELYRHYATKHLYKELRKYLKSSYGEDEAFAFCPVCNKEFSSTRRGIRYVADHVGQVHDFVEYFLPDYVKIPKVKNR